MAIQLRGKAQVMDAYDNFYRGQQDPGIWAIYSNYKNLITKGSGAQDLGAFLDLLSQNATTAIYTLKVYEDLTDPKQVKEKTEASGSINFKLDTSDFETADSPIHYRNENFMLRKQLQELQAKVEQMEAGGAADQTLEQAAIGLLGDPVGLAQLVTAIRDLFKPSQAPTFPPTRLPQQGYQPPPSPVQTAAVNGVDLETDRDLSEQDRQRMADAIDQLIISDPSIADHLEKLAGLAKNNPGMFSVLIKSLENFKTT